ncbi:hypothetical protein [Streptomyces sp. enrichment culture]|uniref:hypothetical protein n=1 Tax=Streptomyces sp. enrichment culture TaxID=1795815 RepID=UPI003F5495FC
MNPRTHAPNALPASTPAAAPTGSVPRPTGSRPTARRDRSRLLAVLGAVLFLPGVLAAGVVTLASERASRCLTYGTQCAPALPVAVFDWSVGIGAVACLTALIAPVVRLRQAAVAVQVLAECAALLVILSHA